MANKRIMIVEDEGVVAEDLKRLLLKLNYDVVGVAADGETAIQKVQDAKPDLVLMDIHIQGPRDGIEVAEQIYTHFDVPVSYLTAYADGPTLERAKATMPFGYILKPFDTRILQTTIELALHRHQMERVLTEMDGWHARALESLQDAVVGADARGRIVFLNPAAEELTGWTMEKVFGKSLKDLIPQDDGKNGEGAAGAETSAILLSRNGAKVPVKYTRSSIGGRGQGERGVGVLLTLRKDTAA